MNNWKACGFISAYIGDLVFIFSEQGGHHITLYGYIRVSGLPLPRTALCWWRSVGITILLKAICAGTASSLWVDVPYHLIVLSVLTGGKWLNRCLWTLNVLALEHFSVFMFSEWIDVVSFDFYSTGSFKCWDQAEIEIHCRRMYSDPILPIAVSETQMVVGFYCKKKKERKLKLKERRDSFYSIVDPHDEYFDALLDCMGSISWKRG